MTKFPATSGETIAIIAELEAKQAGYRAVVETCDERSREHVVAAEMGDSKAKAALQRIQAEETAARASLKNLGVAIDEANRHRAALVESELAEQATRTKRATEAMVGDLLILDDRIDDLLDGVRDLLAQRAEMIRTTPQLRRAAAGEQQISSALLAYFDKQLSWVSSHRYAGITRIAEFDGHGFKTVSPRTAARAPREPTLFQKNMLGHLFKRQQPAA
ncbi:hypothetical protein ACVWXM_007722 [Bradyrhizobium sp. GM7.3]